MDLLVPCIVEGRSELRNVSRVNCKTQWLFRELRNTLLTERICHVADNAFVITAVRLVECAFFLYTDIVYYMSSYAYIIPNHSVFSHSISYYDTYTCAYR